MTPTIPYSADWLISDAAIGGSLALIVSIVLIVLLIQRELIKGSDNARLQRLNQALNIGIVPLLIAFAIIVVFRVADSLK